MFYIILFFYDIIKVSLRFSKYDFMQCVGNSMNCNGAHLN